MRLNDRAEIGSSCLMRSAFSKGKDMAKLTSSSCTPEAQKYQRYGGEGSPVTSTQVPPVQEKLPEHVAIPHIRAGKQLQGIMLIQR